MRRSYLLHFRARATTTSSSSFLAPFSTSSATGDGDESQPDPPLTSSATARGGGGLGGVKPPLPYSGRGRGVVSPQHPPSQSAFAPRSGADARGSSPTPPSSGRGFGGVSPAPPYSGRGNGGVSPAPPYAGRGRGAISPPLYQAAFSPRSEIESEGVSTPPLSSRKPMIFTEEAESREPMKGPEEAKLPSGILSVLSGAGRGTPIKGSPSVSKSVSVDDTKLKQENRHIRKQVRGEAVRGELGRGEAVRGESGRGEAVRGESGRGETVRVDAPPKGPKLSRADAVEKAKGILSKGDGGGFDQVGGRGGGGGRGTRGRGRGRGRGGRGRGRGDRFEDDDVDYEGNEVQDKANEEILAKRLGPEMMNTLVEAFEDATDRVLPSPVNDAYTDALHTNLMIECEPEYMMGEFDQNPDIDEKPPMALRDFLEKVKPFIMSYEGIESQEEWEEAMKETMENVPLMKEIVDYYSGPDRVTAKRQQEELERVAKTLPASAPSSVKRFADRAVLSLQSNPGWGFDKKCQFMDKLVWEASQQYK